MRFPASTAQAMASISSSLFPLFTLRKLMSSTLQVESLRHFASKRSVKLQMYAVNSSRQNDYSYSTSTAPSIPRNSGKQGRRAFADYTFYKGKGAMSMKPGKPIFRSLDSGGAALEKEGSLFLEFAPAVGVRQYDWTRKQMIALSVSELGTLVGLATGENCEFYHDPYVGKSDAGKVRKVLKVEPTTDHSGFFFNFSMSNKMDGTEGKVTVALSRAEYSVLRSSVNFIIPYLMGWHMVADPSRLDDFGPDSSDSTVNSVDEWDK